MTRISRLSSFDPLAISVTWGAGGSTKDRSLDLAGLAQSEYGIDTLLHLTCTNMEKGMVDDALRVRERHSFICLHCSYLPACVESKKTRHTKHSCIKRRSAAERFCREKQLTIFHSDPPRGEEYWIPTDRRFSHGIDLVSYIKSSSEFSDFCVGVAGRLRYFPSPIIILSNRISVQPTLMAILTVMLTTTGR